MPDNEAPQTTPPLKPASKPVPPLTRGAIALAIVIAAAAVAGGAWYVGRHGMHISDGAKTAATTQSTTRWTCSMHPQVNLPEPGQCPICHMDLVPIKVGAEKNPGTLTIEPQITQSIGVRVAPVTVGPVTRSIRTIGRIDYDESAVRVINTKVEGWVEKLYVDKTGQEVKVGQPLFELYAPELYTAQQDYIIAMHQRDGAATPQEKSAAQELLNGIRKRMQYFDISNAQVEALEKSGKATKTMTIASPYKGVVTDKRVTEGSKLETGTELYKIADLSKVWAIATLYEYQLPYVSVGQSAVMTLSYIPGQEFKGKVAYIYPFLNQDLRQARVRLEFDNSAGLLKPGMFANVELRSTLANNRMLVPREAVINTGTRQVALVSLGDGKFEPRDVRVGVEAQDGMVEILDGLRQTDKVVTSGQFLLDSESRTREALAKMIAPAAATQPATAQLPKEIQAQMVESLRAYMQIHDQLFDEKVAGMDVPARKIAAAIDAMVKVPVPGQERFWDDHHEAATARAKALELIQAKSPVAARPTFQDLGIALSKLLQSTGVPASYGHTVYEYVCGMYKEGQGGGVWLQDEGDVRNPYFGAAMPTCHSKTTELPKMKTMQH